VHQSVPSGKDVHECTEFGDTDHSTVVDGPEVSSRRIDDGENARASFLHLLAVGRTNGDDSNRTIVGDADVCTSFLLDGIDDLALRADDFTHLVERNGDADDLRCVLVDRRPRTRHGSVHDVENLETRLTSLVERRCENVGGNAVDLGVELQCRDGIRRTGDLEVHVTEGVFGTHMEVNLCNDGPVTLMLESPTRPVRA
jgi:hypothetical protein